VLIACPPDCSYLGGGAAGWAREADKVRDARRLHDMVRGLTQAQARLLFLSLMGIAALRSRDRDLDDERLASAVDALGRTTRTRLKGVLYEHAPEDARALGLVRDLASMFEAEDEGGRKAVPADRDLLAVLEALKAGMGGADAASPHSFLDSAVRLVGRRAAPPAPGTASPRILA
jgi:hypothetical protein